MAPGERRRALELVPKTDRAKPERRPRVGIVAGPEPAIGLAVTPTGPDDEDGATPVFDALLERLGDLGRLSDASLGDLADPAESAESHPGPAAALQPYRGCFEARLRAATSVASLDIRRLRQGVSGLASRRTTNDAGRTGAPLR